VSITLYSQTKKIVEHTYKELCGNAIWKEIPYES
jgi:hypothetical protein